MSGIRKTYIGVKMVTAEPMTRGEFNAYKEAEMVVICENSHDPGYMILYPDGYESWSPEATFLKAYLPLCTPDGITSTDVESFVNDLTTSKLGKKTAVAQAHCVTGFELTETSACVDEKNYDQEKGTALALGKIGTRLWSHLGFVLQWAINGLKQQNHTGDK